MIFTILCIGAFAEAPDISAGSAVVYEPKTKTVLMEKDASSRRLIASTTKIMTALVVLENCDLDEKVEITWDMANVEGSSAYLKPGESYTVRELLYAMLLVSGNDSAAALAAHTAGNMKSFAELMNEKCEELDLKNTSFANAHGLDDENHYSSAFDLAVITAAAMENEDFCQIFGTKNYNVHGVTYVNHNKLLSICEGCIGGKTGYTMAAGRTFVSVCEREGMTLICVTISAPDDWDDHMKLYDWAYGNFSFVKLLSEEQSKIPVISGMGEYAVVEPEVKGLIVSSGSRTSRQVFLPKFVYATVKAGEKAGSIDVYVDGKLYDTIDIIYTQTIFADEKNIFTPWERFKRAWYLSCRFGVYYPIG